VDPQILTTIPLLAELSDEQRAELAQRLHEEEVGLGTVLARAGEFAYSLCFVVDGIAAATADGKLLTTLQHGDWFGEIGVMLHGTRSADVVAVTRMRLLTLMVWDFSDVMREMPELAARIRQRAVERVERS